MEADHAERIGVAFARGSRRQHDGVIGAQTGGGVDGTRVAAAKRNAAFGAPDEEGAAVVEHAQTREVET